MRNLAIIITILLGLSNVFGQTENSSISIKKVFGGYQYTQNGNRMTMESLVKAMESNSEALAFMKKAKSNNVFALILGGVGGALVGYPLGTAISGGKPNWTLAGIGAGLIVVSIPITQSVNRNTKKAVDIYNGGLQTSSFWDKNELKLTMTGNGVGLTFNF